MMVLGLTGGIGSGKTVVSQLFNVMGIPVYDSDTRSKILTEKKPEIIDGLKSEFGDDIYKGGCLNKKLLSAIIFSDKNNLSKVNSIIHPVVFRDFLKWQDQHKDCSIVVQETAILFEAKLEDRFDKIICVTAPENLRILRVVKRSGLSFEDVKQRIANQIDEDVKMDRSDFIIINDGVNPVIPQLQKILYNLNY